jgi:hypothetical protein
VIRGVSRARAVFQIEVRDFAAQHERAAAVHAVLLLCVERERQRLVGVWRAAPGYVSGLVFVKR